MQRDCRSCGRQPGSEIRRQALLFPIAVPGWLGPARTPIFFGGGSARLALAFGTALGRFGQSPFGRGGQRFLFGRFDGTDFLVSSHVVTSQSGTYMGLRTLSPQWG